MIIQVYTSQLKIYPGQSKILLNTLFPIYFTNVTCEIAITCVTLWNFLQIMQIPAQCPALNHGTGTAGISAENVLVICQFSKTRAT